VRTKIILLFLFILVYSNTTFSQLGGKYAFQFLEQPVSARIAALGSNQLSVNDGDINVGFVNPSMINPGLDNSLGFNYNYMYEGINYGTLQYANTFNKAGSFMATLQYMDYGTFDYADPSGNISGKFGASDFALNIGWGRQLDSSFSIGATAKLIYSYYESYTAFGLGVDVAGTYISKHDWSLSLVARNIGYQVKGYVSGQTDPLPFDLQLAVSKRLDHVPFRFSVIFDQITNWNLAYNNPNNPSGGNDPITGEPEYNSGFAAFGDELMRHLIFGGEIYVGKNIVLRGGYNYRRRQEMQLSNAPGMTGFSWGLGVRVYKFKFNYGRAVFHQAASPNYLSLTFDLDSFTNDTPVKF
jgi:hypothetical protein